VFDGRSQAGKHLPLEPLPQKARAQQACAIFYRGPKSPYLNQAPLNVYFSEPGLRWKIFVLGTIFRWPLIFGLVPRLVLQLPIFSVAREDIKRRKEMKVRETAERPGTGDSEKSSTRRSRAMGIPGIIKSTV